LTSDEVSSTQPCYTNRDRRPPLAALGAALSLSEGEAGSSVKLTRMPVFASDRFRQLLFYVVVLVVGYLAFRVIGPFLAPLAWAGIIAMMMFPVHERLEPRIGPARAALATTLLTAVLIIGPAVLLISVIADQLPQAVQFLQGLSAATPAQLEEIWTTIRQRSPIELPEDPTDVISEGIQRAVTFLAPRAGALVADVLATLGSLFIMLFALFFLLRDAHKVGDFVRRLLPFRDAERERLIRQTQDLVIASVGAGLTVAVVQGLIGGITLWALGIRAPAVWGLAMSITSLIPVVGASLIWLPTAAWLLISGDIVRAIVLAAVGAGVIGTVDNVLRPLLLSGRTSVSGLVLFIGLLGGVSAFGFVGLVVGPVVLVIAGTLIEALTRSPAPPPPQPEP
jgi:predicted PurR-regulated permease PerM